MKEAPRFVLDVHLGRLARLLRMLGFDASYQNNLSKQEQERLARIESRVLLSRGRKRVEDMHKIECGKALMIGPAEPLSQLLQVIETYGLWDSFKPFSRCIKCNSILHCVEKGEISERLPQRVRENFQDILSCPGCRRLYWEGTHFLKMKELIADLLEHRKEV